MSTKKEILPRFPEVTPFSVDEKAHRPGPARVVNFMDVAVEEAVEGVGKGEGGPFGAVIVGPDGTIIARAHNMVLQLQFSISLASVA